jgi:hypothetical protein
MRDENVSANCLSSRIGVQFANGTEEIAVNAAIARHRRHRKRAQNAVGRWRGCRGRN